MIPTRPNKRLVNTRLMQQSVLENLKWGSFYDYEAPYQYSLNQEPTEPVKRARTSSNFYARNERKSELVQ